MATTAVPAAITALVQILSAAPALAGVTVVDGPPTTDMSEADFVAVGWNMGGDDQAAAESLQDFAYAGARARDEDFTISGWLESWTGDEDFAARRARAYELLAVLEGSLRATQAQPEAPTLLGTVLWAHLTRHRLQQQFTDSGARVGISWTVACRARI
ncbi:hypothetical protein [Streptomyces sp. NPDC048438]|uniref:hypothetical protein n=1 Tax=Streptomyces sp. NPDC048438 TaxID=3365551 RepID=UPI003724188E